MSKNDSKHPIAKVLENNLFHWKSPRGVLQGVSDIKEYEMTIVNRLN